MTEQLADSSSDDTPPDGTATEPPPADGHHGDDDVDDPEALQRERELLAEHGIDPDDPKLDQAIRRLQAGATEARPYGEPGDPILPRTPFRAAFQATLGVVLVAALAWAVYSVRDVVLILVVALFLATGLSPAVEWLRSRHVGPLLAPTIVIVTVLGIIAATVLVGLPPLVRQGNELRERLPTYTRQMIQGNPTLRDLDERVGLVRRVEDVTDPGTGQSVLVEQPPQRVLGLAMGVAKGIFAFGTAIVLTLYFLGNFRGLKRAAYSLVPRSRRGRVSLLADEILGRIGQYVLGNLFTSAIAGLAATLVLWWLDAPYPVALGLFVALMDVVPLVGATIGAAVSSAMAFTVSATAGVTAVAFFVLYQQFENFVLVPRVMRHAVDVSPAATIVAILIGGGLLGIVGALLAVPTAAAIQLLITEVLRPRQEAL
jgi:predicted PurR-regulated permease PerM